MHSRDVSHPAFIAPRPPIVKTDRVEKTSVVGTEMNEMKAQRHPECQKGRQHQECAPKLCKPAAIAAPIALQVPERGAAQTDEADGPGDLQQPDRGVEIPPKAITARGTSLSDRLLKRDVAAEFDFHVECRDLQGHFGRKGFCARNAVRRDGFGYCALDFTLRIDADRLEEFADAQVESFFVHSRSPISAEAG
jgi:hypothetical protein